MKPKSVRCQLALTSFTAMTWDLKKGAASATPKKKERNFRWWKTKFTATQCHIAHLLQIAITFFLKFIFDLGSFVRWVCYEGNVAQYHTNCWYFKQIYCALNSICSITWCFRATAFNLLYIQSRFTINVPTVRGLGRKRTSLRAQNVCGKDRPNDGQSGKTEGWIGESIF